VLAPPEDYPGVGNSHALGRNSLACARLFAGGASTAPPMRLKRKIGYRIFAIRYYSAKRRTVAHV
jgi:hypothetical protein